MLLGLFTGIALCLTFGTIFFALIQNSVDNGYKAGLTITAGVVAGDAIFVTFALLGTSVLPHSRSLELALTLIGVIFLLAIGLVNLIKGQPRIAYPKTKLGNYAYYFTTGFLLNALNPINFVSWVTVAAYIRHNLQYTPPQQVAFMGFAVVGVGVAEGSLAIFAHRLKHFFTPNVALFFNRITGVVFILMATRLAWLKLYQPLIVWLN